MKKFGNRSKNKLVSRLILKLLQYFICYLKNLPLTFVLLNFLLLLIFLSVELSFEEQLFKLVSFTLRINKADFYLDKQDIIRTMFLWAIPLTIFIETLKKSISFKITRLCLMKLCFGVLFTLYLFLAIKLGSIIVPLIFLFLTSLYLFLYYVLSVISDRIRKLQASPNLLPEPDGRGLGEPKNNE